MIIGHSTSAISGNIVVIREETDTKPYTESALYFAIKSKMIEMGFDCIKKLMYKDGHMVDDHQYYIRERKGNWCIRDLNYNIRMLQEDFNENGYVEMSITRLNDSVEMPVIGESYNINYFNNTVILNKEAT